MKFYSCTSFHRLKFYHSIEFETFFQDMLYAPNLLSRFISKFHCPNFFSSKNKYTSNEKFLERRKTTKYLQGIRGFKLAQLCLTTMLEIMKNVHTSSSSCIKGHCPNMLSKLFENLGQCNFKINDRITMDFNDYFIQVKI